MVRRLAAILAADVVGYSRLMGKDEKGTLERLKALRRNLVQPKISEHGGRIVKLMGDGLLAEFPSVVEAVHCAAGIQEGMAGRETNLSEDKRIRLRIGVNLGDIIVEDSDIYGDGVNVASRLEALAAPGGVCVSSTAFEAVEGKLDLRFEDIGPKKVKNIAKPVRVYRLALWPSGGEAIADLGEPLQLPNKPSIAVLPFENMSGDPEQEFFSDGVTEDIITTLSSFRSIFVIARNSSFVYKGRAENTKQIGRDLGVRYVLEGSVRKSGGRVRITAQLIEAETGNHIWAQRYDRVQEDVFELQDEITETIVAAIEPELESAERERARRKPPDSLDAWESYQRGMWHAYRANHEDAAQAEAFFHETLARAPQFGPALAGLAHIGFQRVLFGYGDAGRTAREAQLERALEVAAESVRIDDRDAFGQLVYGRLLSLQGAFDEAIERLNLAVELNPNSALAHHGLAYALTLAGRPTEALVELDRAVRLSPKDPYRWAFFTVRSCALVLMKDYEDAVVWGQKGIRDSPKNFWPYAHVVSALGHMDRKKEATQAVTELLRVKPDFSIATIDETIRFKDPADREHYLGGLRKAGLPG